MTPAKKGKASKRTSTKVAAKRAPAKKLATAVTPTADGARRSRNFPRHTLEAALPLAQKIVHELGATSFTYGDRIVIFKEKGLNFPTNFQSIGYIEFEAGDLTARTADLLKELIGFGLVQVTPTQ